MARISIQGLIPDTEYVLRVRAGNGIFKSDWSPLQVFTTIDDDIAPNTPSGLTWVSIGNSFHAEWNAVTQNVNGEDIAVTRYELELVSGATTKIVSVPPTTGDKVSYDLSFENNVALFGSAQPSITLRVRTVDNKELKSAWTAGVTASNAAPNAPASVIASAVLDGIAVSWDASTSTDIKRYEVHVGTSAGFTPTTGNRVFAGDSLSTVYYTTTYVGHYFKVCAVDEFEQKSSYTATSGATTPTAPAGLDTTPPGQPSSISATLTTNADSTLSTFMDVTWTLTSPPADLAGFQIRYRKSGTTNYQFATVDDTVNTARIAGLEPYVNYDVSVQAFDFSLNYSGFPANVTATAASNTAPSTPQAPVVAANTLEMQVIPTGKNSGGTVDMEADVVTYNVYASTSSGFTTYDNTTRIGTIPAGPGASGTFPIPASGTVVAGPTWYVKVKAVDRGGLESAASAQASASVPLISTTNIGNLQVTGAKINDLEVNKLTAGTGLATDFTIKSVLTMGDGSTPAYIRSFDYTSSGGTTGYEISKSGITIKNGSIAAAALQIQDGNNLLPAQWADFEFLSSYYAGKYNVTSGVTATFDTTNKKINSQSLKLVTGGTSRMVYFATAVNDLTTMTLDPSTGYIVSWYAMVPTSATTTNVTPRFRRTGSVDLSGTAQSAPANNTWNRYSTVITTDASTGAVDLSFLFSANTTIYLDGIQVEKQLTGATTPSPWVPPGITTITGPMIRTGAIQSNATALVYDSTTNTWVTDPAGRPAWYIDTAGAAQFGRMTVTGNITVGATTDATTALANIQSSNYVKGSAGWIIRGDGYAEFRDMAADSIDGIAVRAGTLDVKTLKNGDLNAAINVKGSIIVTNPTTFAQVGMSYDRGFFVYGASPDGGVTQGPTYISFPVDGAPNIVSGTLKATTLEVLGNSSGLAASFYQQSNIQPLGKFTLLDQAGTSAAAPIVTTSYTTAPINDETAYTFGTLSGNIVWNSSTSRYMGMYITSIYNEVDGSVRYAPIVRSFNTAGTQTSAVEFLLPAGSTQNGQTRYPMLALAGNTPYVLVGRYWFGDAGLLDSVTIFEMNPTTGASVRSLNINFMSGGVSNFPMYNTALTFAGLQDGSSWPLGNLAVGYYSNTTTYTVKMYGTGQSGWTTTMSGVAASQSASLATWSTTNNMRASGADDDGTYPRITGLWFGNADWGANRLIITNALNTGNHFVYSQPGASSGSLTLQTGDVFPTALSGHNNVTYPSSAGTKFEGISYGGMSQTGGLRGVIGYSAINWGAGTTSRWGVASTRYDTVNGYQSTITDVAYFTMLKRAYLSVTADSGSANASRIYVGRKTSGSLATSELWFQSQLGTGTQVATYSTVAFSAVANAPTTNTFPAAGANGGQIVSDASDSLIDATSSPSTVIRADGYVRMKSPIAYQITLRNTTVAAATAGLETPLRIGTLTGAHTRFGPNSIYAMTNDTTQGTLTINKISVPGSFEGGSIAQNGAYTPLLSATSPTTGIAFTVATSGFIYGEVSASCYVASAATAVASIVYLDGVAVISGNPASTPGSISTFFFNTAGVHGTMPTAYFRKAITAGTHYFDYRTSGISNSDDICNFRWFVMPN